VTLQSTVRLSPDQVSCDLNGEAAILGLHTGTYYGLDPVGATIWKLIEQPRTIESIRDAMLQKYDVDASRCENDLFELLEKLNREGLIEITDPERAGGHVA
jgi:hypothetical protein